MASCSGLALCQTGRYGDIVTQAWHGCAMTKNPMERAYELARSGRFSSMTDLIRALKSEGFDQVEAHIGGRGTRKEFLALMTTARQQ